MSKFIHFYIQKEYDNRQKNTQDKLLERKNEVYLKVPELKHIEKSIISTGLEYNKYILQNGMVNKVEITKLEDKLEMLKNQKSVLLRENEFSDNYLDPYYECSKCCDTGIIRNDNNIETCSCYKQLTIEQFYSHSNLKLIDTENFSKFDENLFSDIADKSRYSINISPRKYMLKIKEDCEKFIENFNKPDQKNLLFLGPAGVGKTFMSNCIAKELIDNGKTVVYLSAPKLFEIINEYKLKMQNSDVNLIDISYKNIFDVDLLIIDDLGIESQTTARYQELLNIFNSRHINNTNKSCKIIISTNMEMQDVFKTYGERIESRIIGDFEILRFIGDDIRKLKRLR